MLDIINSWRERDAHRSSIFTIDSDKAVNGAGAGRGEDQGDVRAEQAAYMTPEYRKIACWCCRVDDVKKRCNVTDEEVKAAYDEPRTTTTRPSAAACSRSRSRTRPRPRPPRRPSPAASLRRCRQGSGRQGYRHRSRPHRPRTDDRSEDRRGRVRLQRTPSPMPVEGRFATRAVARLRDPAWQATAPSPTSRTR